MFYPIGLRPENLFASGEPFCVGYLLSPGLRLVRLGGMDPCPQAPNKRPHTQTASLRSMRLDRRTHREHEVRPGVCLFFLLMWCWLSPNSMADSSTTTSPILNLNTGDCWARRQLPNGIKDVSVASELMKSLTLVRVVFIGTTLATPELDGTFLHNSLTDSGSDCGILLGSTPSTQMYKGRLCGIKTLEIAVFCGGDLYTTIIVALEILYSTADYSTTAGRILTPFAGDCWA